MPKLIDTLGLSDIDKITIHIVLDRNIEESIYNVTLFSKDISMVEPKEGFEYKFTVNKNAVKALTVLRDKLFEDKEA